MRKHLFLAVAALFAAAVPAVEYKTLSYKEKLQSFTKAAGFDDAKLFGVTFDKLHLNSDWCRGRGRAQGVKDINLALRGLRGFDTLGAYRAEPDEDLKYSAMGNVDPHEGTMIFWAAGLDHNPGDRLTDGKKRTNIALSELRFGNGKDHISIKVYEYNGGLSALWSSSAAPEIKGLAAIAVCNTRIDFVRGQWYQVAVTWNRTHLAIYVNGKLRAKSGMPAKHDLTAKLRMKPDDSFIGIRSKFYDDDHRCAVGIDDYVLLKRALTDIEIANSYAKLVKGGGAELRPFSVNFNGVDTGAKTIDKLEAVFDLSGLENEERKQLNEGKLPIHCVLTGPDGKVVSSQNLNIRRTGANHIFDGVDKPGKYTLAVTAGKHKGSFSVVRPDFSFLGNGIGEEETIPEVFKGFRPEGRKVRLWNRVYVFGEGPLPERIEAYGKSLLTQAPVLSLDDRKITWRAEKTVTSPCSVTYTGTGTAKDCTIRYRTKVEYDGLIDLAFTIGGQPTVNSMRLDWQVRRDAAEFLLTPQLKPAGACAFPFPISKLDSQLWLAGEGTGGFCWTAENDANWVYGDREKVLFGDTDSGKCSVRMITRQVKLPEDVTYTSLFIATPTRPLNVRKRFNAFGGAPRYPQSVNYTGADQSSGAFTGVFDLRPGKEAGRFWDKARPRSLRPYNAADCGSDVMPEALYLRKYAEIPGEYSYRMPYWRVVDSSGKQVREYQNSISFCNGTFITDYLMRNNKILLDSKYGSKIGQLNYDLAHNTLCGNPLHKCAFRDRFGRLIKTFVVLKKRRLFERTIRLCHPRGITLSLHAQDRFCPVMHGMGDIWQPGEQHCAVLKDNPFALIDGTVNERLFRSEYNRDVIGTGLEMGLALAQLNRKNYDIPEATIASMTMMLLYDIDFSRGWTAWKQTFRLWDIFQRYDFGSPEVAAHKFYRQKEVTSDNPRVQITWYDCPRGRKLFALCNRTKEPQKAVINFGGTIPENISAREEFYKKDVKIADGKTEVVVPPRAFLLIGTQEKSR